MLLRLLLSCLLFTGCYTQLSLFNPTIEDEVDDFYPYSAAGPMKSVGMYAQDGAGQPLDLAYTMMYNRFSGFNGYGSGYYNKYDYYNRFGYHAGYNGYDSYKLAGYTMYIPTTDLYTQGERKPRTFSTSRGDNSSPGTNLNTTRTRTKSSNTNSGGYSNSSNITSTRSTTSSTSTNSSSNSGGRRVTKRH